MPSFANVTIEYGPYYFFGVVEYRTQRLQGLVKLLTAAGHKVELQPVKYRNLVDVSVNGRSVFTCDILDLDFGGDGQLDCMCKRALDYVNIAL